MSDSSDIITTVPQTIIETILSLLPVQEAARTSILSRDWRYKWTKIPKLVFCESIWPVTTIKNPQTTDITSARKYMDRRCKLFYAIHQVLLLHQAPIHEFAISMTADSNCFEIDQILLHLSRNHSIKKLKLNFNVDDHRYKLPQSINSFLNLTELYLRECEFDLQQTFNGFGTLKSLHLEYVVIPTKALRHFLSHCPSLKSLSLLLGSDDHTDESSTITELFECLPMVEHLTSWAYILEWFVVDPAPKEHPALLTHLKYFCFTEILSYKYGFLFLAILIKCSPNLEKIKLEFGLEEFDDYPSDILQVYSDVWLEHLNGLEMRYFSNLKLEMDFLMFILARSPNLKKVRIRSAIQSSQKEFEMLENLLQAPRASLVEFILL